MAYSRAERLVRRVVVPLFVLAVVVTGAWLGGSWFVQATGLAISGGEPTIDPLRYATPEPSPLPVEPSGLVPPATVGSPPDGAALQAAIDAVDHTGVGDVAWAVVDPSTGAALAGGGAETFMVPASTQKLLTAAAALATLGADHRFTTQVVQVPGGVILVGGGDPYLTGDPAPGYPPYASLTALADLTAQALQAAGTAAVTVGWDDSWFQGPGWNEGWDVDDDLYVTPTSGLWIDHGVTDGNRSATAAQDAGGRFAALLRDRGVAATDAGRQVAPVDAAVLAQVASAPLRVIVQEFLLVSDNDVAEVLFRQVSRARGGDGSLASAQKVVPEVLGELGLWTPGMVADDGSGLSRANRTAPLGIAGAVALGLRDPAYRSILAGLPTAGGDGTLSRRFNDPEEQAGRGTVRAKTGSLTGVNTLGGMVRTRSGAIVAFGFMVNNTPDDWAASDWVDRASSAIAAS
jgi:D-alanyl-D-alanine carboxypeptidase/D-alanyl-D-alanine-endopeptidase (penicillin-binding protein 4)